ncbi:MAG: single-stranded DNA-binding protein, partial [Mycobacteriales bacterium]
MSTITVTGNLVDTPELRYTDTGRAAAHFRVAENDGYRNAKGEWVEQPASFYSVVTWG